MTILNLTGVVPDCQARETRNPHGPGEKVNGVLFFLVRQAVEGGWFINTLTGVV